MNTDTVSNSTKCVCIEISLFLITLADGQGKRQNLQSQLQIFICSDRLFQLGMSLTVCEASDPSESGDRNMGHIPIHAEGEGGGVC